MSEQVIASAADALHTVLIDECVAAASAALAAYEYLITFTHECNFIWARRWSAVTWLFLANRYLMVAMATLAIVPVNIQMPERSIKFVLVHDTNASADRFSSLRVLALTGRNYILSGVVLLLGLVPVGVSIFVEKGNTKVFQNEPVIGPACSGTSGIAPHVYTICVTSSALVLADIIVLVVTWVKTYRSFRLARAVKLRNFSEVLLQDGTIYFIASLTLEIFKWSVFLVPIAFLSEEVPNMISNVIQPLLVSRFLINLRQVDASSAGQLDDRVSPWASISLRVPTIQSIIGNMGAPLDDGLQDPLGDDAVDENAVSEHTVADESGIVNDHAICAENGADEELNGFSRSPRDAA